MVDSATAIGPLAATGGTVVGTGGDWLPYAILLGAGMILGLVVLVLFVARGRIRVIRR